MSSVLIMEPNEYDIVSVLWADAHAGAGHWAELETEDMGEHLVLSVGLLVTEDNGGKPHHVTLAQSKSPDGFFDHVLYIPSGMVRKLSVLEEQTKGLTI